MKLGYMRLIVLAGLVSVEKIELAVELGQYLVDTGSTVTIIDNVRRLAVDEFGLNSTALIRLGGELRDSLLSALEAATTDVALLAVAETMPPDDLFLLLHDLRDSLPGLEIQTLALIDTRTCDCFPQLRVSLEEGADVVVNLPAQAGEVMERLS